ncbi:MAG: efflux RND transporter periplasmic adaptor subunit [Pseudomonadota bacterium]
MKRGVLGLVFSLTLLAAPAWGAGQTIRLGELTVTVSPAPDPPRTGENRLDLVVAGPAGAPVDGAKLGFLWDMPAMGAMPEMRGRGEVKPSGNGRYAITYPLSMNGDWVLTVSIEAPGRSPQELKMKVATGRPGIAIEDTAAGAANAIVVSPARQQLIGVTFGTVERRPLATTLRAAGRVEVDERNLAEVTLKYEAFVQKLLVAENGKAVRRGQPLAVLYSPDLLSAQEELLAASRSGAAGALANGLERRLAYWDFSPAQLQAIEKSGKADGRVTVVAPASGVVIDKNVVEGARVEPGTSLYRIGNLGRVWVQAAVAERDASFVSVGQPARVRLPALPEPLEARVAFVAPMVSDKTRTVEARLEIKNPRLALKPGMFVDVQIDAPLGSRLSVPDSALLLSGEHQYVFVDRGGGRLQPVEVEIGARAGDYAEVRSGLAAGDRVATGATFLLSSEAKLRDVLPRWGQAQ